MNRRLGLAVAATLLFVYVSATDLTITFNMKAKGMLGSGTSGTEIHYYTSAYQLTRGVESKQDQLVDFDKGITYSIDHKKKTIAKLSFDDAMAALDSLNQAQSGGASTLMASLFGDPNDVHVEKMGMVKVADHNCQGWHIAVGKMVMDLAADPSLKLPMPDAAYVKMTQARAAQFAKAGPMGQTFKRFYEELSKIKGIPLKTHLTAFMGSDVTSEATKVETTPIPAATFTLPDGYKVTDMGETLKKQLAKGQ